MTPRVRRIQLTPFKYYVYYATYPDRVEALTIVHQRQHPDTWFGGGLDPNVDKGGSATANETDDDE